MEAINNVPQISYFRDHCIDTNDEEKKRLMAKGARLEKLVINGEHCGPTRVFKGSMPYPG